MGFKDQLIKLRDNWLIIVLVLVFMLFIAAGSLGGMGSMNLASQKSYGVAYDSYSGISSRAPSYNEEYDFAPDVTDRKIIKSSSLSNSVERGTFEEAELKLKNIIKASDSFILSEYSNSYGSGNAGYKSGSYSIKVDTKKYDSVVSQLKQIGEVTNFNENSQDITGSYTNVNIELSAEKERLKRYNELYSSSVSVSDKLDLTNKIFEQERKIKYLEESINKMDERVEYSNIQVSLIEKRANYANVAVVKFSNLLKSLVGSFNGLLYFVFVVAPWVVAGFVIWLITRLFRKKGRVDQEPVYKNQMYNNRR